MILNRMTRFGEAAATTPAQPIKQTEETDITGKKQPETTAKDTFTKNTKKKNTEEAAQAITRQLEEQKNMASSALASALRS